MHLGSHLAQIANHQWRHQQIPWQQIQVLKPMRPELVERTQSSFPRLDLGKAVGERKWEKEWVEKALVKEVNRIGVGSVARCAVVWVMAELQRVAVGRLRVAERRGLAGADNGSEVESSWEVETVVGKALYKEDGEVRGARGG